jgi:hypothetical protein
MFSKVKIVDPYNTMSDAGARAPGKPRAARDTAMGLLLGRRPDPAKVKRLVRAGDELMAAQRSYSTVMAPYRSGSGRGQGRAAVEKAQRGVEAASGEFAAAMRNAAPEEYAQAYRELNRRHGNGRWPL